MLAHDGLSDGRRLLGQLWRRKGLALAVAAATFLVLLSWIARIEPVYTARALVVLDRPQVDGIGDDGGSGATDPFLLRGEVDLLWSAAVAQRVVDELDLAASEEFAPREKTGLAARLSEGAARLRAALGSGPPAEPGTEDALAASAEDRRRREVVEAYRDRLGIGSDGRSLAVGVSFEASDPEVAAALANAHAGAYIALKADELSSGYAAALGELRGEIERSAEAAREAEREASRFLAENPALLQIEEGPFGAAPASLGPLRAEIAEMRREIAEIAATTEVFDAAPAGAATLLGQGRGEALRSPVLDRLAEREAAALIELRRTEAAFGADASAAQSARDELAAARAAVAEEAARVREGLDAEMARLRALLVSLEALMERELAAGAEGGRALTEYRALVADAEARRLLHEALLQRQGELSLADGLVGADAVLVAPALPPLRPSAPRTTLLALVAAMIAGGAGVAAAFAADALLGGGGASALSRRAGLPDLAEIPLPRRPDAHMVRDARVWSGLRALRARLDGLAPDGRLTVALTEAGRGTERVAIGVGLAMSFAAAGHRTVLVDADRSAEGRAEVLPALGAPVGATSVLRGDASLDGVLVGSVQPNLDILPVGRLLPGDAEALSRPGLKALIDQLAPRHSHVVLLAPGLASPGDVADAARCADAVVVVARRSLGALARLREGVRTLARLDVEPAGFVLTSRLGLTRWRAGGGEAGYAEPPATLRAVPGRRERGSR